MNHQLLILYHTRLAIILCQIGWYHQVNTIITYQVELFHNLIINTFISYYDEADSYQVLTIRERQRFKSIPTQLGKYS